MNGLKRLWRTALDPISQDFFFYRKNNKPGNNFTDEPRPLQPRPPPPKDARKVSNSLPGLFQDRDGSARSPHPSLPHTSRKASQEAILPSQHQFKYPIAARQPLLLQLLLRVIPLIPSSVFFSDQKQAQFGEGWGIHLHSLSPSPRADTKVPNETAHKHSKVAVIQSRLVWEHRELRPLPLRQSVQKPTSKRSNGVPRHRPNSRGEDPRTHT